MNGRAGTMPALYDDQPFTVNFIELSPGGEQATLAHKRSINTIYMPDDCMPGGAMFVSVLDAIQGDGFNPLWLEVQVVFDNPDFACQQLDIGYRNPRRCRCGARHTRTDHGKCYRCSVLGPN